MYIHTETQILAAGNSNKSTFTIDITTLVKIGKVDGDEVGQWLTNELNNQSIHASIVKIHKTKNEEGGGTTTTKFHLKITTETCSKGGMKKIMVGFLKHKRLNKSVLVYSTGGRSFQLLIDPPKPSSVAITGVFTIDTTAIPSMAVPDMANHISTFFASATITPTNSSIAIGYTTFIRKQVMRRVLYDYINNEELEYCVIAVKDAPRSYKVLEKKKE